MRSSTTILLIALILLGQCTEVAAQTEPESALGELQLQAEGKKTRAIRPGEKATVRYMRNPRTYRGLQVTAVSDSSIALEGQNVALRHIEMIRLRNTRLAQAGKLGLWIVGGLTIAALIALILHRVLWNATGLLSFLVDLLEVVVIPTAFFSWFLVPVFIAFLLFSVTTFHIGKPWQLTWKQT